MIVRACSFPVLRGDSSDYIPEAQYKADVNRHGESGKATVHHRITGKNLVAQMLAEGKAVFACVTCVPSTMYRTLEVCQEKPNKTADGAVDISQTFDTPEDHIDSPPVFHPIVVARDNCDRHGDGDSGLDELYRGEKLSFPVGAIIASAGWFLIGGGVDELLMLQEYAGLKDGQIDVEVSLEHGGRFMVRVNENTLKQLKLQADATANKSIYIHALSAGLQRLAEMHGGTGTDESDDSRQYANLRMLADMLKEKGYPTWDEWELKGSEFKAEVAATAIRPHMAVALRHHDEDE